MTYNLYAVRDIVASDTMAVFMSKTDGMAVRENLPALSRIRPVKDIELIRIGKINTETLEITEISRNAVSWDAYKFPEAKSEEVKTTMKKEQNNGND